MKTIFLSKIAILVTLIILTSCYPNEYAPVASDTPSDLEIYGTSQAIVQAANTANPVGSSSSDPCAPPRQGVRYVISGNGVTSVSLTWQNDTGGTNQGEYNLPFCKTYLGFSSGDFLYISVQISEPTSGAGSIICRIYDGNNVVAEANANGFSSIATCSGSK